MIEFSCADFTFPTLPHDKVLKLLSLMEFKWVDIGIFKNRSHLQPADQFAMPDKKGAALRVSAKANGLSVNGIFLQSSLDFREYAINSPRASVRKQERDEFKKAIDYTLSAGCYHFTGLPGCDFGTEDSLSICLDELSWRVDYARTHGVTYAVEPHIGSIMENPEDCLHILEKTKGLTIALDHSHYVSKGIGLERIRPLTVYASILHARGAAEGLAQAPFELSTTDYHAIANHLQEVGYAGKICMEYCYLNWEGLNRTDNISETMKLRQHIAELLNIEVLRTDYTCG